MRRASSSDRASRSSVVKPTFRRQVSPPITAESATWTAPGELDYWVQARGYGFQPRWLHSDPRALVGERADEGPARSNGGRRSVLIALAPALTTVPADEPPGLHVPLAFHVDEPHRLRDEVVAQELPGRTRDLDLV